MMKKFALAAVFLASGALAGTAAAAKTPRPNLPKPAGVITLAKVNGEDVTSSQMLAIFTNRHGGHAKFLGGEEEARSFLKIVIEDRLLVQEAYAIGLDEDATIRALVEEAEQKKTTALLIKMELDEKSKPTNDEIKGALKELGFFIHARQIASATKHEAEEVRRAILGGADFETLARTCSLAESRLNGGHIMASWGQQPPEWEAAVFALEPGEVSESIETNDGYEIVIVDNRFDLEIPPLDKVTGEIEKVLSRRKLEARKAEFSNELWSRYHVVLAPLDATPSVLATLLSTAPDTVVATWDEGGTLKLKDTFDADEIQKLSVVTPTRFRHEVDKRIRTTVNGSLVILEAKARKLGETPEIADEISQYRDYIMEAILFRDHVYRDVTATEEDLKAYFESHRSEFNAPEQRRVAQIMVPTEAEAKKLAVSLMAGADFAELARKASKDFSTAQSGGDLGWITADKVPPPFKEVLSLQAGGLSKPTMADNQWHIIKVLEIKPEHPQELDEVKDKVRDKILEDKKRVARQFWVDKLRAAATISIDDAAIKKFIDDNKMKGEMTAGPAPSHAVPAGAMDPDAPPPPKP